MTDKKLKVNSAAYTELSIQIAVLQASVDKLLQLVIKNDELNNTDKVVGIKDHVRIGFSPERYVGPGTFFTQEISNPPQWPNESRTDYLKRIGQWNEAQSTDEEFTETYK